MRPGEQASVRPLTLGEKRQRAADLRRQDMTYPQIGSAIGISAIRARDLCRAYDRYCNLKPPLDVWFELSNAAIATLVTGKHGRALGGELKDRIPHLLEIASAYSETDLASEETAGPHVVNEIAVWLQSKGRRLRKARTRKASADRELQFAALP